MCLCVCVCVYVCVCACAQEECFSVDEKSLEVVGRAVHTLTTSHQHQVTMSTSHTYPLHCCLTFESSIVATRPNQPVDL